MSSFALLVLTAFTSSKLTLLFPIVPYSIPFLLTHSVFVQAASLAEDSDPVSARVRQKFSSLAAAASGLARSNINAAIEALPPDTGPDSRAPDGCEESESADCDARSLSRVLGRGDWNLRSLIQGPAHKKMARIRKFILGLRLARAGWWRAAQQAHWFTNVTASFAGRMARQESRLVRNMTTVSSQLNMEKASTEKSVIRAVRQSNNVLKRNVKTHTRKIEKFSSDRHREVAKADAVMAKQGRPLLVTAVLDHSEERMSDIFHTIARVHGDTLKAVDKLGVTFDEKVAAIDRYLAQTVQEVKTTELAKIEEKIKPQQQAALNALNAKVREDAVQLDKAIQTQLKSFQKFFSKTNHTRLMKDLTDQLTKNISTILDSAQRLNLPDISDRTSFRISTPDYRRVVEQLGAAERVLATIDARPGAPKFDEILRRAKHEADDIIEKVEMLVAGIVQGAKARANAMKEGFLADGRELKAAELKAAQQTTVAATETAKYLAETKRKFEAEAGRVSALIDAEEIVSNRQVGLVEESLTSQLQKLNQTLASMRESTRLDQQFDPAVRGDGVGTPDDFNRELDQLQGAAAAKERQYRTLMNAALDASQRADANILKRVSEIDGALATADQAAVSEVSGDATVEGRNQDLHFRLAKLSDFVNDGIRKLQASVDNAVDRANDELKRPLRLALIVPSIAEAESVRHTQISNIKNASRVLQREVDRVLHYGGTSLTHTVKVFGESLASFSARLVNELNTSAYFSDVELGLPEVEALQRKMESRIGMVNKSLDLRQATSTTSIGAKLKRLEEAIDHTTSRVTGLRDFNFHSLEQSVASAQASKAELDASVARVEGFNVSENLSQSRVAIDALHALLESMKQPVYLAVLTGNLNTSMERAAEINIAKVSNMANRMATWRSSSSNESRVSRDHEQGALYALNSRIEALNESLAATVASYNADFQARLGGLDEILSAINSSITEGPVTQAVLNRDVSRAVDFDDEIRKLLINSQMAVASKALAALEKRQAHLAPTVESLSAAANALGEVANILTVQTSERKEAELMSKRSDELLAYSRASDVHKRAMDDLLAIHQSKHASLDRALHVQKDEAQAVRIEGREFQGSMEAVLAAAQTSVDAGEKASLALKLEVMTGIIQAIRQFELQGSGQRELLLADISRSVNDLRKVDMNPLHQLSSRNVEILQSLETLAGSDLLAQNHKASVNIDQIRRRAGKQEVHVDDAIIRFTAAMRTAVAETLANLTPLQ